VLTRITQFYLPPTRLSTSGMNHTCLYSPAAEHYGDAAHAAADIARHRRLRLQAARRRLTAVLSTACRRAGPACHCQATVNRMRRLQLFWSRRLPSRLQHRGLAAAIRPDTARRRNHARRQQSGPAYSVGKLQRHAV